MPLDGSEGINTFYTTPTSRPAQVAIDLHVHTALSPCGDAAMRPGEMLLTAERKGVGVLGVVDHCSARNAPAVMEAAEAFRVRVFVGLEVESAEGVHILALFDDSETALAMDEFVAAHLPGLQNNPDVFGEQHILNMWGETTGIDERLLVTGTDLSIEAIAERTVHLGGMSIPSHIDRTLNGLLHVLGFIPPDLRATAYELSQHTQPKAARERWPELRHVPLVTASDAHFLADIGAATTGISAELADARVSAAEWGRLLAEELMPQPD